MPWYIHNIYYIFIYWTSISFFCLCHRFQVLPFKVIFLFPSLLLLNYCFISILLRAPYLWFDGHRMKRAVCLLKCYKVCSNSVWSSLQLLKPTSTSKSISFYTIANTRTIAVSMHFISGWQSFNWFIYLYFMNCFDDAVNMHFINHLINLFIFYELFRCSDSISLFTSWPLIFFRRYSCNCI
jgi:hypothetical protein